MNKALAVRSIDFTLTRVVGVIIEDTWSAGEKFKTALMILLEIDCRVRMRVDKLFKVAFTSRASLRAISRDPENERKRDSVPDLLLEDS
jgi:hypothetical protein